MAEVRSWAGLDVHAAKVIAVTVDSHSGELRAHRLPGDTSRVVAFCAGLPEPAMVAYEAGPTGFGLARALAAAGTECIVAAPGKIERPAQDRVKTDRRDAERLVRLLMIGGLHPVRVPTGQEEALRDLVRAREDVRGDLMRARHRMGKLLLRHGVRYDGAGDNWTQRHRGWLGHVELPDRGAQVTLLDYLGAIDALVVRRDALEQAITELVPGSPWAITVARLRCLRGIDTLSAVGLCAEIGDWERFRRPGQLMSFLGLGPPRTAPASSADKARSPSRARATAAAYSSKPPGTTAAHQPAAPRSAADNKASPRTSSRSPERRNSGCTAPGDASTPSAASAARSSRSPPLANSPASAGRSPPPTDQPRTTSAEEAAGTIRPTTRESIRDSTMSTRPSGHARS